MQAAAAAGKSALDRYFPGLWLAVFFFLAVTRAVNTAPDVALTVLALAGAVFCAAFRRDDWRRLFADHALILVSALVLALAILWSQSVMVRHGGLAGVIPAQAPLLICLPVLAIFLKNARHLQAVVGLFAALSVWHFFSMPLEAVTGFKLTWHPVEFIARAAWPFKYQASGLAVQSYTFVGLFLPMFYLAWGPLVHKRAFPNWRLPVSLMAILPLLWLVPVATVQSRSALAGAFVAGVLAFVSIQRGLRPAGWLLLIGCAAVAIGFYLYLFAHGKTGPELRIAYLKLYLRESLDWPWLATGRGYPYGVAPPPVVPGLTPLAHSHNDIVQVFFSWGLPGLAAYLAFWAGLLRLVARRFVARGEHWPALALVAVLPNLVTDVGFHFFEKAAFLVILAAMCMACAACPSPQPGPSLRSPRRGEGGERKVAPSPPGREWG